MEQEPLAISQLVRLAVTQITQAATWDLLQSAALTDPQLAALQRDWTELEFIRAAENALAMERAMGMQTLEELRASHSKFRSFFGGVPISGVDSLLEMAVGETKTVMWQFSWSYPDEQRMLQGYQAMLEAARVARAGQPFTTALRQQDDRLGVLGFKPAKDKFGWGPGDTSPARLDLRSIFSESVVSMRGLLKRVMEVEAARQLTVTAIAGRPVGPAYIRPLHFPNIVTRESARGGFCHYLRKTGFPSISGLATFVDVPHLPMCPGQKRVGKRRPLCRAAH